MLFDADAPLVLFVSADALDEDEELLVPELVSELLAVDPDPVAVLLEVVVLLAKFFQALVSGAPDDPGAALESVTLIALRVGRMEVTFTALSFWPYWFWYHGRPCKSGMAAAFHPLETSSA